MVHDWEVQSSGPDNIVNAEGPDADAIRGKMVLAITPKIIPDFIPDELRKEMESIRLSESHEVVNCELCGEEGFAGPRLRWMRENHQDSLYACCKCVAKNSGGTIPEIFSLGGK